MAGAVYAQIDSADLRLLEKNRRIEQERGLAVGERTSDAERSADFITVFAFVNGVNGLSTSSLTVAAFTM